MRSAPVYQQTQDLETSFVIRQFEIFYLALLDYKLVLNQPSLNHEDNEQKSAPAISQYFKNMLESMAIEANQKGGDYAYNYFKEAMFIMACLADEVFLNISWEGRTYWEDNLLESRLFNTHDAGDIFFQNLDQFLNVRDPLCQDLAEIYLLALSLGFQGKYRNNNNADQLLKAYRHKLYVFINHHDPKEFNSSHRLFTQPYDHTLDQGHIKYLQDLRYWMYGFAFLFILLFIVSVAIWKTSTLQIRDIIDQIFELSNL